jgi:DNA-binding transcriptional regulator YhcF (GntR family)
MITTGNLNIAYRDDLTTQSRDDMKVRLLDFVKTRVNSFIKLDVLHFFNKNRHTVDSVENIAGYLGRKTEVVKPALAELVDDGLVEQKRGADKPVYALTSDETSRALIDQFIKACENRHFRIEAIEYVIRGMR